MCVYEYSKVPDLQSSALTSKRSVLFQQPRPGPNLPKGESYLTIGWKQVRKAKVSFQLSCADRKLDFCRFEKLQEITIHIRLSIRSISPLWRGCCRYKTLG